MNSRKITNMLLLIIAGLLFALLSPVTSQSATSTYVPRKIYYLTMPNSQPNYERNTKGFPCSEKGKVEDEIEGIKVITSDEDDALVAATLCSLVVYTKK